ncbi:hypothetical protein [Virgibacillus indicus]|uniref:hypothetical protein n=1 Tax=Virgibacillus indicus TaxID=2024554 RepID=UPI0013FD2481|nr:hypothetical protein [Virgibacillus indicus]
MTHKKTIGILVDANSTRKILLNHGITPFKFKIQKSQQIPLGNPLAFNNLEYKTGLA